MIARHDPEVRTKWDRHSTPGVTIAVVIEHVAWEFRLPPAAILGKATTGWITLARCAVVWLVRRHVAATHEEIAAVLDRHPQTTVWWQGRARRMVAASADTRALFGRIDDLLGAIALEAAA